MFVQMPIGDRPTRHNERFSMGPQYAERAHLNHFQTLERLAERGGLSWSEGLAIIENREWYSVDKLEAADAVRRHFAEHPVTSREVMQAGGVDPDAPFEAGPFPPEMREPSPLVRRGDWMQTHSGRQYWPLDPRPEDVDVQDIAHHLAMICRYCGACSRHYSVAEHSVYVSLLVPPRLALHGLFHDAAEAYCNDIVRPVKRHLSGYDEIESLNQLAIAQALGLPFIDEADREEIKAADNAILLAEQAQLMAPAPAKWQPLDVPPELVDRANVLLGAALAPFPPGAKYAFMARYEALS